MSYTTLVPNTTITSSWANANVRDQVTTPFASVAARDSAITSPVNGMVCVTTDTGTLWRYNGTKWLLESRTVYKAADTTYTSQTTLQTDPDLQFTGDANGIYEFQFVVGFLATATPKYKWTPVFPSAAVAHFTRMSTDSAAAVFIDFGAAITPGSLITVSQGPGVGATGTVLCAGTVFYGATGGTFAWQAAQNTSSGTSSNTLKGSWLRYRQVG